MRCLLCSLLIAIIHASSFAQVVNIESQRMQSDTTGWLGNFGTNFLFQKNAVEVLNINLNAHVQYKTQKNLYLFLANYNLLKGSGETLTDNLFYHLRYNHKFNAWLRWEVFTQLQQNSVTGIDVRVLTGTGPRFKLHGTKQFALYIATAAMYEYEKEETSPPVYHRDVRSSSYVSFTYRPVESAEIISTIFYQPLFRDFNDYRILNEISLKFRITKHFSFKAGWYYLYDSAPAASTPKLNYSISNGVEYDF
jgi:putative salt-induced outer membrane protein YdiY